MVPDPVLRDYLKEDLTYSDYRDMAFSWQKYTEKRHPSSRELSSAMERTFYQHQCQVSPD